MLVNACWIVLARRYGLPLSWPDFLVQLANADALELLLHLARREAVLRLQAAQAQIRQLATTDALTGLVNRRGLVEQREVLLRRARRTGSSVAVPYLDVDGFKQINDVEGHTGGDRASRWPLRVRRAELPALPARRYWWNDHGHEPG